MAEQKSLDLGLGLLMSDSYKLLLKTICATPEELSRFRALVINQVMATDLGKSCCIYSMICQPFECLD